MNHLATVCRSSTSYNNTPKKQVQAVDYESDDSYGETPGEIMTMQRQNVQRQRENERWFTRMSIDGHITRFLLDCGATVNLISMATVTALNRQSDIRKSSRALRMFDNSLLSIAGVITLPTKHLKTGQVTNLEFHVSHKHEQAILGCTACYDLQLLAPIEDNICSVTEQSTHCITEAEITAEFADLFKGVGQLEGDVHLDIDKSVPPVQIPLRRLPMGIWDMFVCLFCGCLTAHQQQRSLGPTLGVDVV